MSVPYIIYNGVDSRELGVIIEKLPDFHRAQRRVAEKAVPGRSGALVQDDGAYELNTATLRINCNGVDLRTVYDWLRGEGWLISSDEPEYMAYAYLYNGVDDQRFRAGGLCYDTLAVNLRLEPYLRLVEEASHTFGGQDVQLSIAGEGSDAALPLFRLTSDLQGTHSVTATLVVNGVEVYFSDVDGGHGGCLWLDCEAGIAYYEYTDSGGMTVREWAGDAVSLDEGEWPSLRPGGGSNLLEMTSDGQSAVFVTVYPQWRFL